MKRKLIIEFFLSHENDKKATRNHLLVQNIGERFINRTLESYAKKGYVDYKQSSGRNPAVSTKQACTSLLRRLKKNNCESTRESAKFLKVSQTTICRMKKKLSIETHSKSTAPLYRKNQAARVKSGSKTLYKLLVPSGGQKFIIMDDETYVPCDSAQIPGKEYYNTIPGVQTPTDSKVKRKEKFPARFLVWQAINQDGVVSEPYVTTQCLNGQIYLNDIIKGPFLDFVKTHNDQSKILFWPDLATSHYVQPVQNFLKNERIAFVPKNRNPPNFPQGRPIEQFWALCKQEYRKTGKNLTNLAQFKRVWKRISKMVAEKHGKKLFDHFRSILQRVGDGGPDVLI